MSKSNQPDSPEPIQAEGVDDSALAIARSIAIQLQRIADHFDPPPPDKVDSRYVADRLGVGVAYVSQLTNGSKIPRSCIVPGTGNGKPWKFFRSRIDPWIETR